MKADATQAKATLQPRERELTPELIKRLQSDLVGEEEPVVVLVFTREELDRHGPLTPPVVGYYPGNAPMDAAPDEPRKPFISLQGSGECCINHLRGFWLSGRCVPTGQC